MRKGLLLALAMLALAPVARAGGPTMLVGAAEDAVKQPTAVAAKARMDLAALAGFDAIRVTEIWAPGETAPAPAELTGLRNAAVAARQDGIRLVVSVYQQGSRTTPLDDASRAQFAQLTASIAQALPSVTDFVIGNEPNLNGFWLPQFNPDGSDAAAPAYEQLLAQTYDALKVVSPQITVIGGAVSPHGVDRPNTGRDTHSPTTFLADLGAAYRASGRTLPIMDELALHPYEDNSTLPPSFAHPNSSTIALADYDKLVGVLGTAFDGTAQPGSTLPILYDEFGVQSQVPAAKASLYSGTEQTSTKPVDEATQGSYYAQAVQLAFCQPNVRGLFLFHVEDEPALDRWQSGVYYADGSAKSDLAAVRTALLASRRGIAATCPGLELTPKALQLVSPRGSGLKAPRLHFRLECDIDCRYAARLERVPGGAAAATVTGTAVGGVSSSIAFPARKLSPGSYRVHLTLVATVNVGPPAAVLAKPFRIR